MTPAGIESLAQKLVTQAATCAADRSVSLPIREKLANIAVSLSSELEPSEGACSEVMTAALASADDAHVLHLLLVAAHDLAPDETKLAGPVLRLCARAHAERQPASLEVALTQLARVSELERVANVPEEWFANVSRGAGERLHPLVRVWFQRSGGEHPGFRALVREHEAPLFCKPMPIALLRGIHAAQPTVSGWVALAGHPDSRDGRLGISFGENQGEAVATLQEARDGAKSDAAFERLSRWLRELSES